MAKTVAGRLVVAFEANTTGLTTGANQAGKALNRVKQSTAQVAKSQEGQTRASRKQLQAFLEVGRGAEDFGAVFATTGFAGGIRASANNLAQFATILNPAAGAVTGLAIGIGSLLIPQLLKLGDNTEKVTDKLEEFKKSLNSINKLKELDIRLGIDRDSSESLGDKLKESTFEKDIQTELTKLAATRLQNFGKGLATSSVIKSLAKQEGSDEGIEQSENLVRELVKRGFAKDDRAAEPAANAAAKEFRRLFDEKGRSAASKFAENIIKRAKFDTVIEAMKELEILSELDAEKLKVHAAAAEEAASKLAESEAKVKIFSKRKDEAVDDEKKKQAEQDKKKRKTDGFVRFGEEGNGISPTLQAQFTNQQRAEDARKREIESLSRNLAGINKSQTLLRLEKDILQTEDAANKRFRDNGAVGAVTQGSAEAFSSIEYAIRQGFGDNDVQARLKAIAEEELRLHKQELELLKKLKPLQLQTF